MIIVDRYLAKREEEKNPIKVANELKDQTEVEYAEPNLVNRFQSCHVPTDTHFAKQWHLRAGDGPNLVANADVSATEYLRHQCQK